MLFIFALIWAHLVADYPLQGEFLATQKERSWVLLATHAWIQAGAVGAVAWGFHHFHLWMVGWIFGSHAAMDAMKARWLNRRWPQESLRRNLWLDQAVHLVCLLPVWLG